MPLTHAVTLESVKESSGNKNINLKLAISDNGVECDSKVFRIDYKDGDDIMAEAQEILKEMQKWADDIVADRTLYHKPALSAGLTWLNSQLDIALPE